MDEMESFSCDTLFPVDPDTGEPALENPADCEGVLLR
jgi:hypothetical protein